MRRGFSLIYKKVIAVAAAVVVADQISKAVISAYVDPFRAISIIPGFFNIVNWRNPGSAFGMFASAGSWKTAFLSVMPLLALVIIAFVLRQTKERFSVFALSLIAGGAVGNLIDRLRFGEVIDFLDFYAAGHHWPAFNVADSAITVGVILYIYVTYKTPRPEQTNDATPEGSTD